MKVKAVFSAVLVLLSVACAGAQELTDWTLSREGSSKSFKVTVPCTVAGALNQAGVLGENVYEGENYKNIDKNQFDTPWIYTTKFKANTGRRNVLRFNSLCYSADIYLNGKLLASADTTVGPFIVREFDVSGKVKASNTLKVKVYKAPAQSLNHGYVDWNPRPVDESMGILGAVTLISTPDVQIRDLFVKPIVNVKDLSDASFLMEATLVNLGKKPVKGTFKASYEGGYFELPVSLAAGETKVISYTEKVENPRIWWSAEMGKPELYTLNTQFAGAKGAISHSKSVRFGLRDITSELVDGKYRRYILNGKKVLIKSAGWTDDLFMQDTHESLRTQALMVRDMGLNSIRFENIWGKDDYIYDLCDELGLLAIVGFSCQWEWEDYCGLPETRKNGCISGQPWETLAARYFKDQVIRLRNHPAVITWLTGSDRAPLPSLEEEYMKIFNKYDYRPYVCSASGVKSSVTGHSGMKMAGPYEYVGPDYWYIDTERGGAYGFNTETNPGLNIPQAENVKRLLGGAPEWPLNNTWDYHCTASASHMNNMDFQVNVMNGTYGKADSFADYVKKAHALDYDATRSMYEAFRCNIDKQATGIVNWMLNSAWPSMYWQLYDWYLVPTAGYYGVKNACAPVQLIYNYGEREVWVVNDAVPEAYYSATVTFLDANSKVVSRNDYRFRSKARRPFVLETLPEGEGFLSLELKNADGKVVAHNFYCVPAAGGEYVWNKADWWGIPMTGYADLTFVSRLPQVMLDMETTPVDGGILVTVTNNGSAVSYQNILKAYDRKGNLVAGPVWEDNFFSLIPGESRTVLCSDPDVRIKLDGWNSKVK
jgi:exo-1,4-beta-D-glucosaminidase